MKIVIAALLSLVWASDEQLPLVMRARTVAVDPAKSVFQASVVGAPGHWTNINLPEEFSGVMCGDCVAADEKRDDAEARTDPRKWKLEINEKAHSLHVKPVYLPSVKRPLETFATNIYLVLAGGYRIDLQLSIDDTEADSVLTIEAPNQVLLSGRMQAFVEKRDQEYRDKLPGIKAEFFADRMLGLESCDTIRWNRPHRTDKAVARIVRLGATEGSERTFWAVFAVENRGDTTLYLEKAELSPTDNGSVAIKPEKSVVDPDRSGTALSYLAKPDKATAAVFRFKQNRLRFGEVTHGIVVVTLEDAARVPSEWKLLITPSSLDRRPMEIVGIRY